MSIRLLMLVGMVFTVRGLDEAEMWAEDHSHIVVIPDVHGDVDALLRSVWLAQKKIEPHRLVPFGDFRLAFTAAVDAPDSAPALISGLGVAVAVVQLGDLVDRGPHSAMCMLTVGAIPRVLGWRLVRLYGNHEIMAMLHASGKYLHAQDAALFGNVSMRNAAFSPGGYLHKEISENYSAMARLGSKRTLSPQSPATLFVHGGIDIDWLINRMNVIPGNIEETNEEFEAAVRCGERGALKVLNEDASVLWTRDFDRLDNNELCGPDLDLMLQHFQVARIVVGHMPQRNREVNSRCDGRIILADAMMSRWMIRTHVDEEAMVGGNPVALVFKINPLSDKLDSIIAHYTDLKTGTVDTQTILFGSRGPFSLKKIVESGKYFLLGRKARRDVPKSIRRSRAEFEEPVCDDETLACSH